MSRILLISLAAKGHINPLLALAKELVAAGHTVGWLPRAVGHVSATPLVAGVDVRHIDWRWLPPGRTLDFAGAARSFEKYVENNIEWRLNCIDPLVPRLRQAIRDFAADIMVVDGQVYPGVIAACHEGVPFVSAVTSPAFMMPAGFTCDLTRTLDALAGRRAEIFASHGVAAEFAAWDCLSPRLNVVFTLPELVGSGTLPPRTLLVGPSIDFDRPDDPADFPWHRISAGKPLVYASFGTVWYSQPDLFRIIDEAAASLDLQLVAVIGALTETGLPQELAPGTLPVAYAPQLALLERAAVCISHGGANSVSEALFHGVPQLVVPLCTDQPVNGWFVERSGAGLCIAPSALTVEACREALLRLLDPAGPERAAAGRIARAYRATDGARIAARCILDAVETAPADRAGGRPATGSPPGRSAGQMTPVSIPRPATAMSPPAERTITRP